MIMWPVISQSSISSLVLQNGRDKVKYYLNIFEHHDCPIVQMLLNRSRMFQEDKVTIDIVFVIQLLVQIAQK